MDAINPRHATTVDALFRERVSRSPDATAYVQYDDASASWISYSWGSVAREVTRWRRALAADDLAHGERAAIRMGNRREWAIADQACIAAGLVVTPLYADDRADNVAYILAHTEAKLLLVETAEQWREMLPLSDELGALIRVVVLQDDAQIDGEDSRVISLAEWLKRGEKINDDDLKAAAIQADDLATIVYTSGTTGKPKGVMLLHANLLACADASLRSVAVFPRDKFLSFLPLSHMFERTVGYYVPMMAGATVAFNRAIPLLLDDLSAVRPTLLITVPRIFERAYSAIQNRLADGSFFARWLFNLAVTVGWRRFEISQQRKSWHINQIFYPLTDILIGRKIRARFGGNLRCVISGGAPLAKKISRTFIALGIDILQGYGLTETSPTLTVNTQAKNLPDSIGLPLAGVEIKIDDAGELHARGDGVMLGYWRDEAATRAAIDAENWFASGDLAAIDDDGFIRITGRRKEIIVLANGEKVPPADMEAAICDDALFAQAMVVGEGRAFLCALIVLDSQRAAQLGNDITGEFILAKIADCLRDFPGYATVHRAWTTDEEWTVENGMLTPTLKLKRPVLREKYKTQIDKMYEGH